MTVNTAKQTRTGRASHGAIIAHGLFPTALAGWFAALFALSMLAIRAKLVETAVLANGLDSVLPTSGSLARLILAGLLGIIGAGLGYALARLLQIHEMTRPQFRESQSAQTAAQASDAASQRRQPIRAHAELGTAGFDGNLESAGFDGNLESAGFDGNLADTGFDGQHPDAELRGNSQAATALAHTPMAQASDTAPQPAPGDGAPTARVAENLAAENLAAQNLAAQNLANAAAEAVQSHGAAATRIAASSLEDLSQCELIERLAIALHARQSRDAALAAQEPDAAPAAPHNEMAASRSAQLGAILAGLNGNPALTGQTGANDSAPDLPQPAPRPVREWHPAIVPQQEHMAVNGASSGETVASLRAALASLRDVKQAPGA